MQMQELMKYPFAIFDMDGTLVDSMPFWHRLGRDYLLNKGKDPEDDLEQIIAAMTLKESAEYFCRRYELDETPEQVIQGFKDLMADNYRLRVPAKPGAVELVRTLYDHGIRLSVCSATPVPLVRVMLERLGILSCFDHVTSCDEAGAGKDRPDAFLLALERAGAKPQETLLFEDADFAVRTAAALGMHIAAVYDESCHSTPEQMQAMAEYYIHDFTGLG